MTVMKEHYKKYHCSQEFLKKRDMSQVCLGAAQHFCCVRKEKRHSTPISKPHPNCGVWLSRSQEALQLFERNFKFYGRISAKHYMNSSLRNIGWCNKNIDPQDTSLSINNTEQWLKKSPDNNSADMLWYEMWHWRRLFNQNISEILMSWQNLFFNFSSWLCKSNNRLQKKEKGTKFQHTIILNMIFQHLILEDATELRQGFQVDDVNYQRPEDIIQGQTQLLQQLTVKY